MMNETQLLKKIAKLETINDHLASEVKYVDHLMRLIGFTNGLSSVKESAQELLEEEKSGPKEAY